MLEIAKDLSRERQSSLVMVLHDLNLAYNFSDVLLMLSEGNIYAYGAPDEVLTDENVEEVYGIKVATIKNEYGNFIVPVRKLN